MDNNTFTKNKFYDFLEEFCDYLQTLNFAAHTINSYNKDLKEYAKFLEIKNISIDDADHYSVRDYLFLVQERHFSDLERAIDNFLATEWCRYLKKYLL